MRSQLTRHVLRRRLVHRGILPSLLATAASRPSLRKLPVEYRVARACQRRTFLSFFKKPPRVLKGFDLEPGFDEIMEIISHKRQDLRLPPRHRIVEAFREFFKFKKATRRPVNQSQAKLIHELLDYLVSNPGYPDLTIADLRTAQYTLSLKPRGDGSRHVELSKALFVQIRKLSLDVLKSNQPKAFMSKAKREDDGWHAHDLAFLLRVMCDYGASVEARDYLLKYWAKFGKDNPDIGLGRTKALWIPVVRGLAAEDRQPELLDFLPVMEKQAGIGYIQSVHEIMTTLFARRDDFSKMKEWFEKPPQPDGLPSNQAYAEAFRCAIRNNERDWAKSLYQDVANRIESAPTAAYAEESVRLIYRFAVLLLDKGAEHVKQMMTKGADMDSMWQPSIDIVNVLVEAAMEKGDIYLAERFASMVDQLKLEPNKRYYGLQMEYRTRANDLEGAFAAYQSLQTPDTRDEEDWPLLNKFIRALCMMPMPAYDRVLDVTSYIEQKRATLEPETVVSICMAFLRNEEQYEVIDTLSLHVFHYSHDDRQLVLKAFLEYCLDQNNSTARVWDAYSLLRQFFPDVLPPDRVKVMEAFFKRKRPDMATQVFGHMRQLDDTMYRPTLEIYVRCFEGISQCPDREGLKIVHNMLKMDTTITPDTQLHNALMMAYAACGEYHRALDFWKEISNSIEGPSYNSLEIVFRTYEMSGFYQKQARQLWDKLHRLEIDIPPKVYTAYLGFLAAHGYVKEVQELLEKMEAEVGEGPGFMTLGVVYNALPFDIIKTHFEDWAKERFKQTWEQLTKSKRRKDADGDLKFQFLRPWKA